MDLLGFEINITKKPKKRTFIAICEGYRDNSGKLVYTPVKTYGFSEEEVEENWPHKFSMPIICVFDANFLKRY